AVRLGWASVPPCAVVLGPPSRRWGGRGRRAPEAGGLRPGCRASAYPGTAVVWAWSRLSRTGCRTVLRRSVRAGAVPNAKSPAPGGRGPPPVGGRASGWPRPISRVCLTVITGQCRSGLPRASTFGRSRCGDRRRTPLPAGLPPRIAVATCGCAPRRRAAGARPDPPLGPRVTFPLAGAVILLPPARVHAPWRAAPGRGGRHRPHGTGPAGLPAPGAHRPALRAVAVRPAPGFP